MKNNLFSLLFLLFSMQIFAQKHDFLKVPPLTDEEVQSVKSTVKGDVPVEILYISYHYRVDYQGVMYIDVVKRVKIYNKEKAGDYLENQISTYEGANGREKLFSLKAFTYNFENGKIKSIMVEKDSKFKSKEDKNYNITKFAFPEVKNGSVVEYSYSIETPFYYSIPKVMVQREIPIKYFEYVLDAPIELGYTINYSGSLKPTYAVVEQREMYGGTHKTYSYGYDNIAVYKDEKFVGNNDNFKSSIKPEVNSTYINREFRRYTLTWEDVRKKLYEHENFGGQLKKNNSVKNILPSEIKSIVQTETRSDEILKFVQKNYKWNNEVGVLTNEGVKNLISTKIGNAAEINILLILLLRDAGIEAEPVVLSTVGKGSLNTIFPSLYQLNYVIAYFQIGTETILYDATNRYSSKNTLPPRALNYVGYLMTDKKAKEIDISYKDNSETTLSIDAKLNSDGTFSGQFSDADTKLFAMMNHEMYDENKQEYEKNYKERYNFPLKNIKTETDKNGDIATTFEFDSDIFIDNIGNKLVFNPLLFLYAKNHEFDQEEVRKSPLEFFSPYKRVKKVTITLPEGFAFENVPASKKFRTDDDAISYLYFVKQEQNKLTVETTTTIDSAIFPKEYYPAFKQIFDNITKLEGQVVTVVKSK